MGNQTLQSRAHLAIWQHLGISYICLNLKCVAFTPLAVFQHAVSGGITRTGCHLDPKTCWKHGVFCISWHTSAQYVSRIHFTTQVLMDDHKAAKKKMSVVSLDSVFSSGIKSLFDLEPPTLGAVSSKANSGPVAFAMERSASSPGHGWGCLAYWDMRGQAW